MRPRPPTWRGGIKSINDLQLARRRLERRRAGVTKTLTTMQCGESLHLHFAAGRPLWRLSGGRFVADEVAALIIARPEIVSAGDALFAGCTAQTYRYQKEE